MKIMFILLAMVGFILADYFYRAFKNFGYVEQFVCGGLTGIGISSLVIFFIA